MIRVTFVSQNVRGIPREYDTDDTDVAISDAASRWYRTTGDKHPAKSAVFAVVIERGENRLSSEQIAKQLEETAGMERFRATHG